VKTLFRSPAHPYTRALQESIPRLTDARKRKLEVISGMVPNPLHFPPGCRFHPRCKYALDVCREQEPKMEQIGAQHQVRCFMYDREKASLFERCKAI
jgi:peptide/nickel transport system ATP-binding protein/oligopeptide transport system ATP-binding protein